MLLLFLTGAARGKSHGGRVAGKIAPFPRDFAKPEPEEQHKQAEFIAVTFLRLQLNVPVSQRIVK
jgi:hypothetical protein